MVAFSLAASLIVSVLATVAWWVTRLQLVRTRRHLLLLTAAAGNDRVGADVADAGIDASDGPTEGRDVAAFPPGRSWREGRMPALRHPHARGGATAISALQTALAEADVARAELEYLAHHDSLTALPNRRFFLKRLAAALSSGRPERVGVLYLDLDRFKPVNDLLGHAAGDALLRAVACRLRDVTPSEAVLARIGGDEFAVLVVGDDVVPMAGDIAARIVTGMATPFVFSAGWAEIGVSVGIAIAKTDDVDQLLRRADEALYAAKRDGGGAVRAGITASGRAA